MYPLRALFGNLFLGPVNREDVVLEGDLDVLRHHARKLGHDADRVSLLDDVHRRHPRGGGAVAQLQIGPGQRVAQQPVRSEEHTSELQSLAYLVCRLLLEKKKIYPVSHRPPTTT